MGNASDSTDGERIAAVRRGLGLNQRDFAAKIGVTQPAIHQYETGKHPPNRSVMLHVKRLERLLETRIRKAAASAAT